MSIRRKIAVVLGEAARHKRRRVVPKTKKATDRLALKKIDGYPGVYALGEVTRDKREERRFLKKVARDARKFRADILMGSGVF